MCKTLYVIPKEKCQMPFPTDRALNDADKVKTGRYRYKKKNHKCILKKDKMMAYSSLPPRAQPVLSLFQLKTPILGKWLANNALLVSMLFSLIRNMCDCYDYWSHHCGWTSSPPPPKQLFTTLFCIMCTSVKTVSWIGSRETFYCPKYILIYNDGAGPTTFKDLYVRYCCNSISLETREAF